MEVLAYFLGILIGVSLGLIGSGGSILTIPVLVYFMKIPPANATAYSLFIVGFSALAGSIKGIRQKRISPRIAALFGIPGLISIFIMRKLIVPALPSVFCTIGDWPLSKDLLIMLVFAVLMIGAAISMIRQRKEKPAGEKPLQPLMLIFTGTIIGLLTGFVGVGGGFLIIPALIFLARLPMKNAVATSLLIIAVNALIGFAGSLGHVPIDWFFLLSYTAIALAGIFIGMYFGQRIEGEKLKPIFGWFVLFTGIYIILRETLLK